MEINKNFIVNRQFLNQNKNICFIFGSSLYGNGYGGAAALRDCLNSHPFVTKLHPNNLDSSFYRPKEYFPIYKEEIIKLKHFILTSNYKTFLITKLGSGLANKYKIWEEVIEPNIKNDLAEFGDKIIYLF